MLEEQLKALPLIRYTVHQNLDLSNYKSWQVHQYINCFAHAIGSTITACPSLYRLGMLSEKKPNKQEYFSENEVKNLFVSDLGVLELKVQELEFVNKVIFLSTIQDIKLEDNEHIVVLFVKKYADKKIYDFHFIRFDKDYGWSEKYFRRDVYFFKDISQEWPCFWFETVGAFKITR